jgi:hypothetical protein
MAQHIRRQFEKLADRELSERQAAFGLGTIVYQGPTWICDHEGEIVMDYDFRASTICRYLKKHVRPDVWWLASAKFAFCIPKLRTSQKARHDYVSQLVSDLQELDCEVSDMVIDEDSPFGVGYAITVRHRDMVSAPGGSDDQAWAKEWAMQIAQTMGLSVDLWIGEGVEPTSDTHYEINPHQSQEV